MINKDNIWEIGCLEECIQGLSGSCIKLIRNVNAVIEYIAKIKSKFI